LLDIDGFLLSEIEDGKLLMFPRQLLGFAAIRLDDTQIEIDLAMIRVMPSPEIAVGLPQRCDIVPQVQEPTAAEVAALFERLTGQKPIAADMQEVGAEVIPPQVTTR
jgi:hypothetical protein